MPCSLHLISNCIPGYGPPDGRCLPCSGVSGKAISISSNSFRSDYKIIPGIKLRCVSMRISTVCNASPGNYRRSPDYARQKQSYSRNRNRNNNNNNHEERDGFEELEESETLSQKNGALLSFSGNQKFQATATPGPREKEIVELFRKVQGQLRERAAIREEKKVDDSQGYKNNRENETVDSLLKLLRKHSVQQGKKNTNNSIHNRDFILDDPEKVSLSTEESQTNLADLKIQEVPSPQLSRPKSNFQKRSPVPEIKLQSTDFVNGTSKPESEEIEEVGNDAVALLSEEILFDEMSDDEEDEHEDETNKLNGMKLTELRAMAKSLGMKGFSKLKKNDLVNLLTSSGSL